MNLTIPSIKNYQNQPPTGGWNVIYEFRGQEFPFTGHWRQIATKVKRLHAKNGSRISTEEVFKQLNAIWCARDPGRCMTPAQAAVAQKATGAACRTCGGRRRAR